MKRNDHKKIVVLEYLKIYRLIIIIKKGIILYICLSNLSK